MKTVIKIVKLNRSRDKVSISISSLAQPLVVSEETIYRRRLVDGTVITPAQLEQLKRESGLFLCDREATRLLALREHSTGEIRTKLRQKGFEPAVIKETINKFKRLSLLDDARYALGLAQRVVKDQPCGKLYLMASLQRKMIDRTLAEQTVEMVLSGKDETEQAVRALQKRWREFSQFELGVARKKAYNYLARRSFGYEAAKQAFEQLVNQKQEDNPD